MKKEIPRMLRNASTVYAFDFFQTLLQSSGKSIFRKFFGLRLLCNPHRLGIRWIIIAALPKIVYPFIKLLCIINGMNPVQIILSDKWFSVKDSKTFILNTILNISNEKITLNYVRSEYVRRVRYISNDVELIKYINNSVSPMENNILAETVSDFWNQKFECVI